MRRGWSSLAAVALVCGPWSVSLAAPPDPDAPMPPVPEPVRYDGHKVVRVTITSLRELQAMQQISRDTWACGAIRSGPVEFRVSPEELPLLDAAGIPYEVVIEDVQALIDAERAQIAAVNEADGGGGGGGGGGLRGPGWFSTYHSYQEISQYIDTLIALRPDLATRFVAGQSLEGRDIFGIRITSPTGANKPGVYLHGLQHAREWITGAATMFIADRLVRNYGTDAEVTALLDACEFYIIPVANPDGYVYTWTTDRLWRKNRRPNSNGTFGVDLNRNWGFQWGGPGASTSPGNETYRGTGPFSEPETQALRDFILAHGNIVFVLDVHSFQQLILSPWGFTDALPFDASLFSAVNAAMEAEMEAVAGVGYTAGPTYSTIYPAAGVTQDWSYGSRQILGWGFELRPNTSAQGGFILPAEQIVPASTECWRGVSAGVRFLLDHALYFSHPDGQPEALEPLSTASFNIEARRGRLPIDTMSVRVMYRVGRTGAFTPATLIPRGGQVFTAQVQTGPCGSVLQYYIEARTTAATGGLVFTYPAQGAAAPVEVPVAEVVEIFSDDFETNRGWSAGVPGDTATSGQWVRVDPNGTIAQPEDAHSPTMCFVTGQGPVGGQDGAADVDNGRTTLMSPVFDMSGPGADRAVLSYWRWYSNTLGAAPASDVFVVDISNNGGASWTRLETVGPGGPGNSGGWIRAEFRVADVIQPTSSMRLRFIAEDAGAGSLIEAAVDDVMVRTTGCSGEPCRSDWDRNGVVNSGDISFYLSGWIAELSGGGGAGGHDFNADGEINSADISAFLADWITGTALCGP